MRIRGSQGKFETKGPHMVSVTLRRTEYVDGMTFRVSKTLSFLDTQVEEICADLAEFATVTSSDVHADVQNATTGRVLLVIRYGDTSDRIKVADNRLAQNLMEECDA